MPITEDRIRKLREFGLSEYGARVYLALLDLGIAEAGAVSKLTKVPTSKIYQTLDQLAERGLVEIHPEFPRRYAPVSFTDFLDRLATQHLQKARSIGRERDTLAASFCVTGDVELDDAGGFAVLRGRSNVLDRLAEVVVSATSSVVVLATAGTVPALQTVAPKLEAARRRGAAIHILVPDDPDELHGLGRLEKVGEVRATSPIRGTGTVLAIADTARALLATLVPADAEPPRGRDVALFTDRKGVVEALTATVSIHWSSATPLAERRREISTGRPREMTRFHASPDSAREALLELLSRGARSFLGVSTVQERPESPADAAIAQALGGAKVRALRYVSSLAEARRLGEFGGEVRHVASTPFLRFAVIDGREAFVSIVNPTPGGRPDPVVQTTNESAVKALEAQFEALWASATPIAERVRALERDLEAAPSEARR